MKHKCLLFLLGGLLLLGLLFGWYFKKPLQEARWNADVAVIADIEINADQSRIDFENLRNWRYAKNTVLSQDYFDQSYQLNDLKTVWYYTQPLNNNGLLAHVFVGFEFLNEAGEVQEIGLSLEARKRDGEAYSMWRGLARGFTLTHVWASAEDLVARRQVYSTYALPLQKHRLQLSPAEGQALLKSFARATQELAQTPQFYNTLTHNCASELARYVNELQPNSIPWHYSFILTGQSVGYLKALGYIE